MRTTFLHNGEFESVTRQSVFLGLVRLQELRRKYPETEDSELVRAAAAGTANDAAADVATAARLIDRLGLHGLEENATSMRRFLRKLLDDEQPRWAVAALRGRQALQSAMPQSVTQCFSFARLFDAMPDPDAVTWWDDLVESQRSSDNHVLKDRGREGERLTVHYETERLSRLGVDARPRWVALDDEWLGYDVLSFDVSAEGRVTSRLIEVKACSTLPLRIFLTRNEWEKAIQAKDAFAIHVWHLPTQTLRELTTNQVSEHIPTDAGQGKWDSVQIILSDA